MKAFVKQVSLLVLMFGTGLFLGCSGIKPYPNTLVQNLHITTTTDTGSLFSSVNASLDIYQVKSDCRLIYAGTVKLDTTSKSVGIPPGKSSYLVFTFASSSFLAGSSGNTSYETLLRPRKGYHYTINASYIDDIYDVQIRESHPRNNISRDIETVGLTNCT